jgi:hypothetical protein
VALREGAARACFQIALEGDGSHERRMVDLTGASWNRVVPWMRQLERLRRV